MVVIVTCLVRIVTPALPQTSGASYSSTTLFHIFRFFSIYHTKMTVDIVELPYSLHTRYASIAIAWTVIIIPPIFLNLGLFYGLWYGKPEMDRMLGMYSTLK